MLPNFARMTDTVVAFFQARDTSRPGTLEEAIAQGEAEAAATDAEGWIQTTGPRRRSWMRALRGVTSGPDW